MHPGRKSIYLLLNCWSCQILIQNFNKDIRNKNVPRGKNTSPGKNINASANFYTDRTTEGMKVYMFNAVRT